MDERERGVARAELSERTAFRADCISRGLHFSLIDVEALGPADTPKRDSSAFLTDDHDHRRLLTTTPCALAFFLVPLNGLFHSNAIKTLAHMTCLPHPPQLLPSQLAGAMRT